MLGLPMPARDLDHLEPVLDSEMMRLPAIGCQTSGWQALAVLDVPFAVTEVREFRRIAPDTLKLTRGSRGVQGKLGLDLQLRDDLRVLHLQQFLEPADLELAVEPESVDLHRDVAVL